MPTTFLGALLQKARDPGPSPFPHQATFLLDNPLRRTVVKPGRVIDKLALTGSEHVLELGPGPGFFSVEIARRLTYGGLDLFDLQPEMLDKAQLRLQRAGFDDVGFTAGQAAEGLPFPDDSFDVGFLAAVIGEVGNRLQDIVTFRRVAR
jgi:ubiquinone/menaquinone biosynthesis C-methylase UbiE